MDESKDERKQATDGDTVSHHAGEQTKARLRGTADDFGLASCACRLGSGFLERNRLVDKRLTEGVGKSENEDASDQAREHPAKQKISNHVRNSLSGRGSRADAGRHARTRARTYR